MPANYCGNVTAFEQEHFQWRCQELTSECCNIQERGFDNIRSIRVESGAFVCCEYPGYPGQQYIMECDKHNGDYQHWKTSRC
ncbi:Beta-crystallin A3 [Triplophysa tibetana]|uniref:Beta-crystallin A3 n=1 Tax=Triplophysa tibetana TaxID=1572043 RepID=A0A5A9PKI9_9TELE|nr:Beta-crystallin A3 [Triplophysa tibetana]